MRTLEKRKSKVTDICWQFTGFKFGSLYTRQKEEYLRAYKDYNSQKASVRAPGRMRSRFEHCRSELGRGLWQQRSWHPLARQ